MHLTEWQESGERHEEYCIDENKVTLALEYMTPIKGIDTSSICRRIGSGRITAPAADYDEECRKMALKIGLWE